MFADESGVSERPPIRRTWAPKGETPLLRHPFNWRKLSVAGVLAYRWDASRSRFLFQTLRGTYRAPDVLEFLKILKRHFRGQRVILLWDRLPGHKAGIVQDYLRENRSWITLEWLPAYAPELNPTEFVWSRSKGRHLANQDVGNLDDVGLALRRSLRSMTSDLGLAFLRGTGLSFGRTVTVIRERQ